jgi:hypothetical protein
MKRMASIVATLAIMPVLASPRFSEGQGILPNGNVMPSQLQQPEPLPDTRPDPVPASQPPQDQQFGHRAGADDQQDSTMQTVIGTIVKEHGKYVLKAWDKNTYQIDDQDKAKKYEGELVKIVGRLDLSTNAIRIQSIELKS